MPARKVCRQIAAGASGRPAKDIASARAVGAVVKLAKTDERHAATDRINGTQTSGC